MNAVDFVREIGRGECPRYYDQATGTMAEVRPFGSQYDLTVTTYKPYSCTTTTYTDLDSLIAACEQFQALTWWTLGRALG